jgi:tetratricopeptide (TPR) repeat protein
VLPFARAEEQDVGNAVKKILFTLALLAGAAGLALGFVLLRQEAAVHALLVQQAEERESTDLEMRTSLSQLSDRVDGIAATFSREIAEGSSGTQGTLRRLQRRLADDVASVRGSLSEMTAALNKPEPAALERAPASAIAAPATAASAAAAVLPTTLIAASSSSDVMEQDLALSQALQRAKQEYGQRKFADAVRTLSPFSKQQTSFPELRLYLAASRFCANPSDSSIQAKVEQDLRAVLREDAGSVVALETMGSLYMEQGKWAEARDWFLQVIALKPTDPDALEKTGVCALSAGDLTVAKACFEKAAAIRPTDANLWYEAGSASAAAGEQEEALARFEKCLALDPRHHGARDQAARCLYQLGRYAEATEMADRAADGAGQEE